MKPASAKRCPSCGERYDADVLFCPRDGTPLTSSLRSAPAPERDPYVGMELDGQIRIQHLIGIGSMGRVYRAFQGGIERDVAVKVLHRELSGNADLVARFHREAKVGSRLVHPNVVHVLMSGTVPASSDRGVGGELYLVMEHLDGLSLLSALAAAGTAGEGDALPLPRALHIVLQICDAVGEAHAQGIVHRDLKPENIMLVRRGEDDDYVKVLDFGIARLDWADKMATQAGLIFGTAKYISPEGAEGLPVGPPADVYSIATMLYQCLAGRAPFEADSSVGLLVHHTHTPPPDLRSVPRASYVPAPIAQVVMQNLSKEPADRAADGRALGRDLALAARASGLDPDEIAAQPGMVVKLASKARTRALELSPELAAKIGGVPAQVEAADPSEQAQQPQPPAQPDPDVQATAPVAQDAGATGEQPAIAAIDPVRDAVRDAAPAGASIPEIAPVAEDVVDAPELADPSTMQGVASEARPRPRRARIARVVAIAACAAAAGLIGVLGGKHIGGAGIVASDDAADDLVERVRDCIRRRAWDAPPGDNVREIVARARARWPTDPRFAELRSEASERILADALGRRYAGDTAGAVRLADLALELDPSLIAAQRLADELRAGSPAASVVESADPPRTTALPQAPTAPGAPR